MFALPLTSVTYKKGETVIYPQHGACIVVGTKKIEAFGSKQEYLILKTVIHEMDLRVPVAKAHEVGVRPPVSADELEDLVSVLSKADPRVPSNWSRRFKNHQEKLKSGDVYQVAEVVRNLAARNHDASLSAAERTMYERARINLISEIAPALKVSNEEAEKFLNDALERGVLKPKKGGAKKDAAPKADPKPKVDAADSKPAAKPAAKSAAKSAASSKATSKPAAKPATKPATKPAAKSATKPGTKAASKSPAKPAAKSKVASKTAAPAKKK